MSLDCEIEGLPILELPKDRQPALDTWYLQDPSERPTALDLMNHQAISAGFASVANVATAMIKLARQR
jgi:hypothetical protein